MTDHTIGSTILNALVDNVGEVVEMVYGGLMGSWPSQTIIGIYVALVGYAVLMGRAGEKSKEWGVSALLLIVLGGISGNYGSFTEWVVLPILDAAQKAGSFAAGGTASSGTISDIIDASGEALARILSVIDRVEVPGNFLTNAWMYIKVFVVVAIMAALSCAQYVATVALLCIAFFSLMMMVMVGGICLWLASFKETRFITWTWLKQTINYAMWIFFLGAVSGIGNKYTAGVAGFLEGWDLSRDGIFTADIGGCMLLSVINLYMLLKAADWAAALTGGTASNTGIVGAMGSMAGSAIGAGMGALGRAAGGAGKWGGGAMVNHTAAGNAAYRAYSALKGIGKIN